MNEPLPGRRPRVYSVASLTEALKNLLAGSFPDVGVQGKVSNALNARSGHLYVTRYALPEPPQRDRSIPVQPLMTASTEDLAQGEELCHQFCASCHGYAARGYSNANLRVVSPAIHDAFQKVVREGLLLELATDSFGNDLDETETELIRQHIIARADIDCEASGQ